MENVDGLVDLRERLEARRRELVAWLAAGEHLDAGIMGMLADVETCLRAIDEGNEYGDQDKTESEANEVRRSTAQKNTPTEDPLNDDISDLGR